MSVATLADKYRQLSPEEQREFLSLIGLISIADDESVDDEHYGISPEAAEELDRRVAAYRAGKMNFTDATEVDKEFAADYGFEI